MVNLIGVTANSSTVTPNAETSASKYETTTKPAGPALRVLIVDDNRDVTQIMEMLLTASGHDVLTVHDGPSALVAAANNQPHVIVLDIGLPGINGYEVARKIRQQTTGQNVILVALTGYGEESDRQLAREAGFDHHLVKPTDFCKLEQILATFSKPTTLNVDRVAEAGI